MSIKEVILNKIQILLSNRCKNPDEALAFFGYGKDGKWNKIEISSILRMGQFGELIRVLVTKKLIDGYGKMMMGSLIGMNLETPLLKLRNKS